MYSSSLVTYSGNNLLIKRVTMKKVFLATLLLGSTLSANAQWQRTPTPNDTLQSVRVLKNGNVVYSIYAPKARTVSLAGDAVPWGAADKIIKTEQPNGVWTFEVPNAEPGVYRYHFTVDGIDVYDPKAPATKELTAVATITPKGDEFYAYRKDIEHGAMAVRSYESKTIGTTRTMRVWTPAGYEKGKMKLPVLYLIHGGGDTDTSWPNAGAAGIILDNLLAEGKMKPMIVVMPNGTIEGPNVQDEVAPFAKDMVTDIIPFIEKNYNVLTDKNNRAIAGLSMGGMETMETAFQNIDMFSYVWVLSSSFKPGADPMKEAERLNVPANVDKINKSFKRFVLTQGGPSDIAFKNCENTKAVFDKLGLKYEYMENEQKGHSWGTWRADLHNIAPQLFK